jgi:hypothetical protein
MCVHGILIACHEIDSSYQLVTQIAGCQPLPIWGLLISQILCLKSERELNTPLKRFDVAEIMTKFMAFEESIRAIMTSNPLSTTSKGQRIIKVIRCHFSGIISNACCILWQLSTVISEFLFKE